jgi:hypothetical protein
MNKYLRFEGHDDANVINLHMVVIHEARDGWRVRNLITRKK